MFPRFLEMNLGFAIRILMESQRRSSYMHNLRVSIAMEDEFPLHRVMLLPSMIKSIAVGLDPLYMTHASRC